jgi:hypothetical protein
MGEKKKNTSRRSSVKEMRKKSRAKGECGKALRDEGDEILTHFFCQNVELFSCLPLHLAVRKQLKNDFLFENRRKLPSRFRREEKKSCHHVNIGTQSVWKFLCDSSFADSRNSSQSDSLGWKEMM